MAKEATWEEAILHVLSAADGAMHYSEIAERALSQALKSKGGATPAATVASILSTSLKDPDTPFIRVGRGEYALKNRLENIASETKTQAKADDLDVETGALQAFGMYWQRELVLWSGTPRLLGRQGIGASAVNFQSQVGVYLLHDRDRVIYAGRATDTMFARLKAHTGDRLGGRWDRFSWFGLRGVRSDGTLADPPTSWTHMVVIETLEALLIESLEPPLNRKRGDNLTAVEYLQIPDPEIEHQRRKQFVEEFLKSTSPKT